MTDAIAIPLPDEAATIAFAEDVAAIIAAGDLLALSGDLGAGKTTFARALIRALADDAALEVPSPTFTLVQTYATRVPVAHFDLYRLADPDELDELGLDEALSSGAALIEWPERGAARLPAARVDIALAMAGDGRSATVDGPADFMNRLARSRAIRAFLDRSGEAGATRRHLQGDASTRRYEHVRRAGRTTVLMDWPPEVGRAVPDPRVMFRAKDVRAVVAVDAALRRLGLSAPEPLAADTDAGLLLLEDLGAEPILAAGVPVPERYRVAVDVLALVHSAPQPAALPLPGGGTHPLPDFTAGAFAAETSMFLDWFLPHAGGGTASPAMRADYAGLWDELIARLAGK